VRNPISQDLECGGNIDLSSKPLHISSYLHLLNPLSIPTLHIQIQIRHWFLFGRSSLKIAWIFRFFPLWSYFFSIRHPTSLVVFLWLSAIMMKMKQIMQTVWGVVFCIQWMHWSTHREHPWTFLFYLPSVAIQVLLKIVHHMLWWGFNTTSSSIPWLASLGIGDVNSHELLHACHVVSHWITVRLCCERTSLLIILHLKACHLNSARTMVWGVENWALV